MDNDRGNYALIIFTSIYLSLIAIPVMVGYWTWWGLAPGVALAALGCLMYRYLQTGKVLWTALFAFLLGSGTVGCASSGHVMHARTELENQCARAVGHDCGNGRKCISTPDEQLQYERCLEGGVR